VLHSVNNFFNHFRMFSDLMAFLVRVRVCIFWMLVVVGGAFPGILHQSLDYGDSVVFECQGDPVKDCFFEMFNSTCFWEMNSDNVSTCPIAFVSNEIDPTGNQICQIRFLGLFNSMIISCSLTSQYVYLEITASLTVVFWKIIALSFFMLLVIVIFGSIYIFKRNSFEIVLLQNIVETSSFMLCSGR